MTLVDTIDGIAVMDTQPESTDHPSESSFECEATLLSFWVRSDPAEPERGEARISLWGPKEKAIESENEIRLEIDLREKPQLRTQIKMNSLPLRGPGRYTFKVERRLNGGWETVARVPYDLLIESPGDSDPEESSAASQSG